MLAKTKMTLKCVRYHQSSSDTVPTPVYVGVDSTLAINVHISRDQLNYPVNKVDLQWMPFVVSKPLNINVFLFLKRSKPTKASQPTSFSFCRGLTQSPRISWAQINTYGGNLSHLRDGLLDGLLSKIPCRVCSISNISITSLSTHVCWVWYRQACCLGGKR